MEYKISIVASLLITHHWGARAKSGWLGIRIMCPSGTKCIPAGCSFLVKQQWLTHLLKRKGTKCDLQTQNTDIILYLDLRSIHRYVYLFITVSIISITYPTTWLCILRILHSKKNCSSQLFPFSHFPINNAQLLFVPVIEIPLSYWLCQICLLCSSVCRSDDHLPFFTHHAVSCNRVILSTIKEVRKKTFQCYLVMDQMYVFLVPDSCRAYGKKR